MLIFGLHWSTPFPQILPQSDLSHVDLSARDIQWQIAAEWLKIVQWSQWRAYRKQPLIFQMAPLLTTTTSLSPKMYHPRATVVNIGFSAATAVQA